MIHCARTYADDCEVLGKAPAAVMLAAVEAGARSNYSTAAFN